MRKQFIKKLAIKTNLNQSKIEEVLKVMANIIGESLENELAVSLPDLGKFDISYRKERKGFNPSTREPMIIKAHKVVRFIPTSNLKKQVK